MQGHSIAEEVSTLAAETSSYTETLRTLREQQEGDSVEVVALKQKLADAEEEMDVLRLQAERATLLEVQTEIAGKLVEDLQVRGSQRLPALSQCASQCAGTVTASMGAESK